MAKRKAKTGKQSAAATTVARPAKTAAKTATNGKAPHGKPAAKGSKPDSKAMAKPGKSKVSSIEALSKATARALDVLPDAGVETSAPTLRPPRSRRGGPDASARPPKATSAAAEKRERATSEKSGKYVYCIVAASDALRFGHIGIGVEPAAVHTVNYKEIAAVVSDTPIEVYDPTRENVLAHERVNELVMREHTIIPMSFGTVFKTREDILELLRSAYQAFKDVLVKMQNKLEFGLKVLWDPDAVIRVVEKEDESVRRLKKEISSQKGSTYFARMQYGRLVDAQLQERSERYVTEISNALRDVSVASRANKPIGDRMIMNAAFLVSRDQETAFDAKVKEIGAKLDHLTFKYTGPWPPYNFVNIRLKLERAKNG